MVDRDRFALLSELASEDPAFAMLLDAHLYAPLPEAELTTELLVRYIVGALPDEDARAVERTLTKSQDGRILARDTQRQLQRLQTIPIAQLRAMAQMDTEDSAAARAWLEITQEHTAEVGSDPRKSRTDYAIAGSLSSQLHTDSVDIRSIIMFLRERGASGARALEASLQAISSQIRYAMRRSAPAAARGQAFGTLRFHGVQDADCEVLKSYIDAAGELVCEVMLRGADGAPYTNFDGRRAKLLLSSGGMSFVIGAAVISEGRVEWTIGEIGDLLGIIDAPLSTRFLAVAISHAGEAVGDTDPESASPFNYEFNQRDDVIASSQQDQPDTSDSVTLYAPILDNSELETEVMPVEVFVAPLDWVDDELVLTVTLPPITRAAYPGHQISIDMAAGPNHWQRLGVWSIAVFGEDAQVLRIPFPQFVKPVVLPREWLRFQIRESHG